MDRFIPGPATSLQRSRAVPASTVADSPGGNGDLGSLPGLVGWFDAAEFSKLQLDENNMVLGMENRVPGMRPVAAGAGGGPTYDPTGAPGSLPALIWSNNTSSLELVDNGVIFNAPIFHLYMSCQVKDGTQAWLGSFWSFFSSVSGQVASVSKNTPNLSNGVEARINGGAPSPKVLPLPLSVVEFRAGDGTLSTPFNVARIGQAFNGGSRPFFGPMCEILAFAAPLSDTQINDVHTYLSAKWGIS